MNTASLELSKELYELSDWYDMTYVYARGGALALRRIDIDQHVNHVFEEPPAYDLGFLLRKLPNNTRIEKDDHGYYVVRHWIATDGFVEAADAAATLAIELIKQGILPAAPKQTKEK